jgi:hypothetical protein
MRLLVNNKLKKYLFPSVYHAHVFSWLFSIANHIDLIKMIRVLHKRYIIEGSIPVIQDSSLNMPEHPIGHLINS